MGNSVSLVYIINALSVGGAEVGMCRLLNGLDQNKYDVTVVVLDGRSNGVEDQLPEWVRVVRLYPPTRRSFSPIWDFICLSQRADVIVGSLFHSTIVAKLAGFLNRSATVATWRHTVSFQTSVRKKIFNLTKYLTDYVLVDSDSVAEALNQKTSVDDKQVRVIPLAGVNLDKYPIVTHEETSGPVTVGIIGRLTESKNHSMVLNVADRLQDFDIRFEIAGSGELQDEIESEIKNRELTNVSLRGFVDVEEIPSFLSNLDIYFQPSRQEGLCMTVLEAMASGLPVVGSDVGGIGQNIKHKQNGFLYDPHDTDGFVDAIYTLANDPELRSKFGANARQTVTEKYTQDTLVSAFEDAIDGNTLATSPVD